MIPCTKIAKAERSVHSDKSGGPLFVWNLTSRCNLRCAHCYRNSDDIVRTRELSDDKCAALIREIKALNPPIVLLTGGEPLLRANIFDIADRCKRAGLRVGLSTNGTMIDYSIARMIAAYRIDYVGISIDGNRERHDAFRGRQGAFDASWQAIAHLNEVGVKTGVRFTLTDGNAPDLMDILEKTAQSGTNRFCLYHLVYSGRASKCLDMSVSAKRRYMSSFFDRVKALATTHPAFEVLTTDSPADGVFMSKLYNDDPCARACAASHGGCSAGEGVLYLDADGSVYPCQFLRDLALGNVNDTPLGAIWHATDNAFLNKLRDKSSHVEGKCRECLYKEMCGGCRARASAESGSLWSEDPACYMEESETKDALTFVHV